MLPNTAPHRMDPGSHHRSGKLAESKRRLPTRRVQPGDYMKDTVRRGRAFTGSLDRISRSLHQIYPGRRAA
jgi:hypothetical protein